MLKFQISNIPYFFSYKTEFFSFQNNPNSLDQSYKTDLDFWDCFGRIKSYCSETSPQQLPMAQHKSGCCRELTAIERSNI